jgi:sortase A
MRLGRTRDTVDVVATTREAPAEPTVQGSPHPRSSGRSLLRVIAFGCLMVAFGVGGYVGWLLWGTGLETERAQHDLRASFGEVVETGEPSGDATPTLPGGAYAQIQIPAIDVDFIVVEGTGYEALKMGPGHYSGTADPWDGWGRVGIAGHRTTYQHPFLNLDRLDVGDEIVLHTEFGTFTYDISRVFVIPSEGSGKVLTQSKKPTLVLTTCHPKYSAAERLIVTADLVDAPAATNAA